MAYNFSLPMTPDAGSTWTQPAAAAGMLAPGVLAGQDYSASDRSPPDSACSAASGPCAARMHHRSSTLMGLRPVCGLRSLLMPNTHVKV